MIGRVAMPDMAVRMAMIVRVIVTKGRVGMIVLVMVVLMGHGAQTIRSMLSTGVIAHLKR